MECEAPRPSQDGRVFWRSGHTELLNKLTATTIRAKQTGANQRNSLLSPARNPAAKRNSMAAGLPSPSRPTSAFAAASAASNGLNNSSAASPSTSSLSVASSFSAVPHLRSSASSARQAKRRRAGLVDICETDKNASPSSQLKQIGELAAMLDARRPPAGTAAESGSPKSSAIPSLAPQQNAPPLAIKTNLMCQNRVMLSPRKAEKQPLQGQGPRVDNVARCMTTLAANPSASAVGVPRSNSPFARSTSEGSGALFAASENAFNQKRQLSRVNSAPFGQRAGHREHMPSVDSVPELQVIADVSISDASPKVAAESKAKGTEMEDEPDEYGGDSLDAAIGAMQEKDLEEMILHASQAVQSSQNQNTAKPKKPPNALDNRQHAMTRVEEGQPLLQRHNDEKPRLNVKTSSQRNTSSPRKSLNPRSTTRHSMSNSTNTTINTSRRTSNHSLSLTTNMHFPSPSQSLGISNRLTTTLKKPFKAPTKALANGKGQAIGSQQAMNTIKRNPVISAPKPQQVAKIQEIHPDVQAALDDGAFDWDADEDMSF